MNNTFAPFFLQYFFTEYQKCSKKTKYLVEKRQTCFGVKNIPDDSLSQSNNRF